MYLKRMCAKKSLFTLNRGECVPPENYNNEWSTDKLTTMIFVCTLGTMKSMSLFSNIICNSLPPFLFVYAKPILASVFKHVFFFFIFNFISRSTCLKFFLNLHFLIRFLIWPPSFVYNCKSSMQCTTIKKQEVKAWQGGRVVLHTTTKVF